jgi:hypothetical protein
MCFSTATPHSQVRRIKFKRIGVFRADLMTLGHNHVPGFDFTNRVAPVANGLSFEFLSDLVGMESYILWYFLKT